MALAVTIDPEEERRMAAHNVEAEEGDMDVTLATIAGLTIECMATYIPSAYVPGVAFMLMLLQLLQCAC